MRYKLRDDNINFMFTEGHNIPLSSRGKIVRKMSFAFPQQSHASQSQKIEGFLEELRKIRCSILNQAKVDFYYYNYEVLILHVHKERKGASLLRLLVLTPVILSENSTTFCKVKDWERMTRCSFFPDYFWS